MVTKRIRLLRFCRDRKSAVALMVALMAPVLIGAGALAVDATSWFGTREAVQTAADAAALSASMSGLKGAAADKVAVAAANAATGNAFGFTTASGAGGNGGAVAVAVSNAGPNSNGYTAQVSAPLKSYLLRFVPQFFGGGSAATQAGALRQAKQITTGGGACILALSGTAAQAITISGNARITATNCGVFADSDASSTNSPSSGDAITASGSARITGTSVGAVGGMYAAPYSAYIGDATGTGHGVQQGAYSGASAVPDPLASMGHPPQFPNMPAQPSPLPGTNVSNVCNSSTNCTIASGTFTSGIDVSISSFEAVTSSQNDVFSVLGTIKLTGNNNSATATLDKGIYYLTGPQSSGSVTGLAMQTNLGGLNIMGGKYYIHGGISVGGTGGPVVLGEGQYLLKGCDGAVTDACHWAFYDNVSNLKFTGGTYYFDGGLDLASYGTVTFGPGIYYIKNGDLHVGGSDNIIVNGATFVLEGNAAFIFDGGSNSLNMQAPNTNCIEPSNYPVNADLASFPYDGTNGEGICGVLIYQARDDKAASAITAGANDTLNGIIYAPGSPLTVSGAGNLSAAKAADGSPGTMSLIASTINDAGSGTITASAASGSPVSKTTKTVYVSSLTQ